MNEERKEGKEISNSDILLIYDAKMCNPNGDPDDENKPRMDYATKRNLVSDVRLKRYMRDYWAKQDREIFVSSVNGQTVDATQRLAWAIIKNPKKFPGKEEEIQALDKKLQKEKAKANADDITKIIGEKQKLTELFIDVKLFGATMPITHPKTGTSYTFTGPVQFNWGYSLNKVEIVESSSITSHFAGRTKKEREEQYGAIGKDWRVYYSLLAFHGILSAKRAEETGLKGTDIELLDNSLIKAIPSEATTRSKIGQTPRLLLRIEYSDDTFIGDLRRYVKLHANQNIREGNLRDIDQLGLDVTDLADILAKKQNEIRRLYLWQHEDLKTVYKKEEMDVKDVLKNSGFNEGVIVELPHKTL